METKTESKASGFVNGCAAVLTVLAMLVILGWLAWMFVSDVAGYAKSALAWPRAAGVVSSAQVDAKASGRRMPRKLRGLLHEGWPTIVVDYQVGGASFQTSAIAGYRQPFLWRPSPAQMVAAHPVGSSIRVRHDPDNPARSVIDLGPEGWQLFELLVLMPVVGWVALLAHEWLARRRARSDPLRGRLREDATGRVRIRMTPSTPSRWAATGLAVGTLGAMAAALWAVGRQPSIAVVGWTALGAIAVAAVGACAHTAWTRLGRHDLVVDPLRRLVMPPRSVAGAADHPEGVPFADIAAITAVAAAEKVKACVRLHLRAGANGMAGTNETDRSLDLPVPPHAGDWPSALAVWLRETVGAG